VHNGCGRWDGTVAQLAAESVDVLYIGRHVADFQALPASVLVNQFVGESCVTSKLLIQVWPPSGCNGGAADLSPRRGSAGSTKPPASQPVPIIAKLS
jgi:hypothetical protein